MLVATSLLGGGLLRSSNSSHRTQACTHSQKKKKKTADKQRRQAILVDEFLPIDVTQALEEGQRAKCVGVPNLHIARHCLDQSHEALKLRRYVIWGQGRETHTHTQKYSI